MSVLTLLVGLLAVALLAPAPLAAQPRTHDEALHALRDAADPAARRAAARALGETGTSADVPALVAALRDGDAMVRAMAEASLWQVWSRSGDAEVDRLFQQGLAEMQERRLRQALGTFTRIIETKPGFAEAWNKRATVYFWLGELDKSLADCDEVMKRNSYHFGALSGYGLIYIQLDQPERALEYLERALAINPTMRQVRRTIEELRRELRERGRDTT